MILDLGKMKKDLQHQHFTEYIIHVPFGSLSLVSSIATEIGAVCDVRSRSWLPREKVIYIWVKFVYIVFDDPLLVGHYCNCYFYFFLVQKF